MRHKRSLALLLCAAAAIAVLAAGCSGQADSPAASDQPEQSQSAQPAPGTAQQLGSLDEFSAGTLDGGSFTQDDVAAKDVTIFNFWALTCQPCIREMPDLAAFAGALPENVQVVTVCLDGGGNEALAEGVLNKAGFGGVTLISGDGGLADLCSNLIYTPTTVLADSQGNLVGDEIIGVQQDLSETLLEAVNAALRAQGKAEISLEE